MFAKKNNELYETMKTIRLILTAIILLTTINIIMAQAPGQGHLNQKSKLKTDVIGSYPQEVLEYYWLAEAWTLSQTSYIKYNSVGEPTEVRYVGNGEELRSLYTYNADHNVTEVIVQLKEGGIWVNYERDVTEYLNERMETKYVSESWNGSAWVLDYGTQYEYTLDGDQISVVITTIYEKETGLWNNSSRITHDYSGGAAQFSESIYEMWKDGAWEAVFKTRYEWEGDKVSVMYTSGWTDGAWNESSKMVYEYEGDESMTMIYYSSTGDGVWTPTQRIIDNYDSHGNSILSSIEFYSTDWELFDGTKYLLTYSGDNLTERITQSYSIFEPGTEVEVITPGWKNVYKEEFKDFAALSTNPLLVGVKMVQTYPNPAQNETTLRLENLKNNNITINVMNVTGQLAISKKIFVPIDDFSHSVNLSDLPSGTFIILVRDESGRVVSSTRLIHQQ